MSKKSILLILMVAFVAVPAFSQWSEPVLLSNVNDPSAEDWAPFLSEDGLTLYFGRVRTSKSYYGRIFEAIRDEPVGPFTNLRMYYNTQESGVGWRLRLSERKTTNDPWPMGIEISELNKLEKYLGTPNLTGDELVIFFQVLDKPGGQHDIWMASRSYIIFYK